MVEVVIPANSKFKGTLSDLLEASACRPALMRRGTLTLPLDEKAELGPGDRVLVYGPSRDIDKLIVRLGHL